MTDKDKHESEPMNSCAIKCLDRVKQKIVDYEQDPNRIKFYNCLAVAGTNFFKEYH